jgi:hypothetical protein
MTYQIKITGIDANTKSVLVKYASDSSKNPIDSYDAIAFQLSDKTGTTKESFVASIRSSIQSLCEKRDLEEQTQELVSKSTLDEWAGYEINQEYVEEVEASIAMNNYHADVAEIKASFPTFAKGYLDSIVKGEFVGRVMIPAHNKRGVYGLELQGAGGVEEQSTADITLLRGFDDCLAYLYEYGVPIFGEATNYFAQVIVTHTERVYGEGSALTLVGPEYTFVYFKPTFELAKKFKHHQLTVDLSALNDSGFTYKGKLFQSDPESREFMSYINAMVESTNALVPSAAQWKAEDNTSYIFDDVADWKTFFSAMVTQGAVNYQTITEKKQELASATTQAQLDAVEVLG